MRKYLILDEKNKFKKKLQRLLAMITGVFVMLISSNAVYASAEAAPYYGFGTSNGRTDTININDYHTNSWERFVYSYLFESGGNYRYDLGQPTTYTGTVPNDVYSVNVRRDKNVTVQPPSYGVFSGNVSTPQTNYLFEIPLDPAFANFLTQAFQQDPTLEARFDTLKQGVNSGALGNQINMYNVGDKGTLPNTSVGGQGITPIGGSDITGRYTKQGDDLFYQSGNGTGGTVTTPDYGEFLTPTSIGN